MRITIDVSPAEFAELVARRRQMQESRVDWLPADDPDPHMLTASDARRYRFTGAVADYGEREAVDIRTGRRGVFTGCGFEPGAYVTRDGRVEYDRPEDNPLRGFAGCFS